MCGVIPIATSLLSPPPPNGLNGTSALLLSSQKPEQQNFPESHKAAPLAGASWSDPDSTTGEAGLGALSPTLQQGWVRSVPSCLAVHSPVPRNVLPSPGQRCPWGWALGKRPRSRVREAQRCEVHAECVISSVQCPHCWIRGLENTT